MAVSMNSGPFFVGVLSIRALLFGVYIRALLQQTEYPYGISKA